MHNPFYVPPYLGHQPYGGEHPKPLGVKTVVKRNQPTRLNLALPVPGYPYYVYVPARPVTPRPRGLGVSTALGLLLIRVGTWLAPNHKQGDPSPLGQSA